MNVLDAKLDQDKTLLVCSTAFVICVHAANIVYVSAVVVQSGATVVSAVTLALDFTLQLVHQNHFGLSIYCVLYWRFSGI